MDISNGRISFANQIAIVTGAGRGLGRAYALDIARRGGAVIVNDVGGIDDPEGPWADKVVDEIRTAGGRAIASRDDVSSPEGGASLTDAALRHFGSVDILVNNAGVVDGDMFETISLDQIQRVIGVNLLGVFYATQPAWRVMKKKGYGRIIMTSSGAVFGMQGISSYVASKGGILTLSHALALEGASHGIQVNAVLPYAVSNIRQDRPNVAPDAARILAAQQALVDRRTTQSVTPLILYLASRDCAVTGQAFSALAGRYGRVFLDVTEGWLGRDANAVTAEDIAAHIDAIGDASRFIVPDSIAEELESVLQQLETLPPG